MLRAWAARPLTTRPPWGSWLGLARTLMALGTAGTLAFTQTDALFGPVLGRPQTPSCDGVAAWGLFCVLPRDHLGLVRWVAVLILLVVASGWRPRWTALPHWWVSCSVFTSVSITDGGDQAAGVLTTLLVPILLTDRRRWHWQRGTAPDGAPARPARPAAVSVALVLLVALRIQVAVIYFQACVAKLGQQEWVDGTGMYYWVQDPVFGPPDWLRGTVERVVDQQLLLIALTWAPLLIEFALALSLLLAQGVRWALLPLGAALHLSIAMMMGLWSFSLVMLAALVLLLVPIGEDLQLTRERLRWGARPAPTTAVKSRPGALPGRALT